MRAAIDVLRRFASAAILLGADIVLAIRYWPLFKRFHLKVGYWPRLGAPRTYREKIQWRKLFDRNPLFPQLQDKLIGKVVVRNLAPDQRIPATLWEGTDPKAIPLEELRYPCVLKGNHGCHFNVQLNLADADTRARTIRLGHKILDMRWGRGIYEWAYERIPPKLLVEEMLLTRSGRPSGEYKITMMHGRPLVIAVERHAKEGTFYGYYDAAWARIPIEVGDGSRSPDIERPPGLEAMLRTAGRIAALLDMIRVDFYDVDGKVYFGECTIYPVSGLLPIRPKSFDHAWGAAWDLTKSWFFVQPDLPPLLRLYRWALGVRERR